MLWQQPGLQLSGGPKFDGSDAYGSTTSQM